MKKLILFLGLFLIMPISLYSAELPKSGEFDLRVRNINYNEEQVTTINAHYGFTTHIKFGDDEVITDVAIGDPLAWSIQVRNNHVFLKPKEDNADTNMSILTTKNVYIFDLRSFKEVHNKPKFYLVSFKYPQKERTLAEIEAEKQKIDNLLNQEVSQQALNYNYWKVGTNKINPIKMYDDGRFVYITFAQSNDFPAVFKEISGKEESLLNFHIEKDTMILHKLAERIVLRRGNDVILLINQNYNKVDTVYPDTQMTVPNLKRIILD